jgi:DNA helicase II / ATP-dependent DNA helicase PcrA
MFKARPNQAEIISFRKGRMGVSAVPGSGKTHTLSRLAANLIAEDCISDDQEVLIVTLVNSSVENFSQRINKFIHDEKLLPNFGYRVRTLHGLAHDIVKERPSLVLLEEHFEIADDAESQEIIDQICAHWLKTNPSFVDHFKNHGIDNHTTGRAKIGWEKLISDIAGSFIRQAKDMEFTPDDIREKINTKNISTPLLELGVHAFIEYQRSLAFRGAVDFEDLIRLAIKALRADPAYLKRLAYRWPFVLEDEAQDSSMLQEKILRLLADAGSSWVRVGDPNQAIYETFTTANPKFLREFMHEKGVISRTLPHSGRSTASIISLANHLIDWTTSSHPISEIRDALTPPRIELTPEGDPQPNPEDNPDGIHFHLPRIEPAEEIQLIVRSLKKLQSNGINGTIAVLVPRNERGAELVTALQAVNIDCVELLQTSNTTRKAARMLSSVLKFISEPTKSTSLSLCFHHFLEYANEKGAKDDRFQTTFKNFQKIGKIENFLTPGPGKDEFERIVAGLDDPYVKDTIISFRQKMHFWQKASLLPIDQFILTISMTLFTKYADLATAYKISNYLERNQKTHPDWNFSDFTSQLEAISTNRIRLAGFSDEDIGFDPDSYKGKVIVSTIHKAKGLEWDRVYILSVNNYDFPSFQEDDQYIAERWFIRDELNLQAEILAQLKGLNNLRTGEKMNEEGWATRQARVDYCSERLRLLFVGITRARKELILTWNTGQRGQCHPSLAFQELADFWKEKHEPA